jgi:hypothetical protein
MRRTINLYIKETLPAPPPPPKKRKRKEEQYKMFAHWNQAEEGWRRVDYNGPLNLH